MKVILTPNVNVVGYTKFIPTHEFEIPDDGTDAEKLGSFAAKVCYDSSGKDGRANIENQKRIISESHGSVLEHAHVSLYITGISRSLSLELNRHRPFNISQRSTRYTQEEDSAIVLEPYYAKLFTSNNFFYDQKLDRWIMGPPHGTSQNLNEITLLRNHLDCAQAAIAEYKSEVERLMELNPNNLSGFNLRKWARGKARNILPHSLETRGVWTMNYRALRWFIEARSNRHAEPEMRRLAYEIYKTVRSYAPIYFADFSVSEVIDDIPELVPQYHKV